MKYELETAIPWFGIITTLLIIGMIGFGVYSTPSDAELTVSQAAATLRYEATRNRELTQTPGMENCTFHSLDGIAAIRCPNSTVTVKKYGTKSMYDRTTVTTEQ